MASNIITLFEGEEEEITIDGRWHAGDDLVEISIDDHNSILDIEKTEKLIDTLKQALVPGGIAKLAGVTDVNSAITKRTAVVLKVYVERSQQTEYRVFSPWKVEDGYVTGWDHQRNGVRQFIVANIESVTEMADPPYIAETPKVEFFGLRPGPARLVKPPTAAGFRNLGN